MRKVFCATLGCDKNLVDSEALLGRFAIRGVQPVDDPDAADISVLNSCGFIDAARSDSETNLRELWTVPLCRNLTDRLAERRCHRAADHRGQHGGRGRLVGRRVHPRRCGGQVVVRGLGQRGRVRLGGGVPARHDAASSRRSACGPGHLHPAAIALPTPAAGAVVLAGSCSRHPHPLAHKNARRKSVRFRWNASELTYGERLLRTASVCYGRRASG